MKQISVIEHVENKNFHIYIYIYIYIYMYNASQLSSYQELDLLLIY